MCFLAKGVENIHAMTGVHVMSHFEHETFIALQYYIPEILH